MSAAFLIKPEARGQGEPIRPRNGKHFSLEELHGYVGGYIEALYLLNDLLLIVNEDGWNEGLPLNQTASAIYSRFALPHIKPSPIVGNAVLAPKSMIEPPEPPEE